MQREIQRDIDLTSIADRLHSAAIHLLRRVRRTDPETGVSAAQLSALSVLMGGPRTLSELAAAEQVQPPTMSRLVTEMQRLGLVRRSRDRGDARVVWVHWPRRGQSVLRRGRELRIATLERRLRTLALEEQRTLGDALDILDAVIKDI